MNQLGQLVFTGLSGLTLTDEEKKFIEKEDIGGVILFSKNYESPAQLAELVNSIQVLRKEYPLFICTDHEGGRVVRFKTHFTQFPPMLEIAKLDSPKLVFEVATIMAEELLACGINLNLAPVCDIWNNDQNKVIWDRAFGTDHETVSKFISSMIRGFETNHLMSCAKHFPGHGNTLKDSHYDLPIVKKPLEEIRNEELQPFIKAVKARVDMIMMAHIIVEDIDPDLPCSLSPKAHAILRNELKYKGLILSDDMQMGAITAHRGTGEAAMMAIRAGSDLVEYRDMSEAVLGLEGLKKAQKDKTIKAADFADRLTRISEAKKAYFTEYKPIYVPDLEKKFNRKQNQLFVEDLKKKIAEKSNRA
ncbi:beta-N-acetylhexosaminidase [Bacteriovorax stolpii]|uniref:beta-N-acetylhexosaminidase n=1 Tax=Bacteriovorax stolpii TaxID=960 RepID=A0A2K9NWF7_BACTC|nr:beta-N-acetylhexosaminidase [Bacteriovorax stolpii]AUN99852.1 beta-N-acetylhexosaminidase [Bacteriovorax stolpii]TDP54256.1 beta-N-acetylhexosaminidase [Bacteriovorax stolpii]